jgi:hypothetical protein
VEDVTGAYKTLIDANNKLLKHLIDERDAFDLNNYDFVISSANYKKELTDKFYTIATELLQNPDFISSLSDERKQELSDIIPRLEGEIESNKELTLFCIKGIYEAIQNHGDAIH